MNINGLGGVINSDYSVRNYNNLDVHAAVKTGKIQAVKKILQSKDDFKLLGQKDEQGRTALLALLSSAEWSAEKNEIAQLLIECMTPEQLAQTDDLSSTALHAAVGEQKSDVVKLICAKCPQKCFIMKNTSGHIPLHVAVANMDKRSIQLILEKCGKEVFEIQDNDGQTPLHFAVYQRDSSDIVQLICERCPQECFRIKNNKDIIPLQISFAKKDKRSIQCILEKWGKEAFEIQDNNGNTFLHFAVHQNDNSDNVQLICERCPQECFTIKNNNGHTPLHIAVTRKDERNIQCILEKCGNKVFKIRDNNGQTSLHLAVHQNDNSDNVQLICERCPQECFTIKNNNGHTPLHFALSRKDERNIQCILEKCGNEVFEIRDDNGWTPLHFAVAFHDKRSTQFILEKCKKEVFEMKNNNGMTALHIAAKLDNHEIIKLIIEICGKELFYARNNRGETPIHTALLQGNIETIKFMIEKCGNQIFDMNDEDGRRAIDYAVIGGNLELVTSLFNRYRRKIIEVRGIAGTLLHSAVYCPNVDVVHLIFNAMSEEERAIQDRTGKTALHQALENVQVNPRIVLFMLKNCSTIDIDVDVLDNVLGRQLQVTTAGNGPDRVGEQITTTHDLQSIILPKLQKLDASKITSALVLKLLERLGYNNPIFQQVRDRWEDEIMLKCDPKKNIHRHRLILAIRYRFKEGNILKLMQKVDKEEIKKHLNEIAAELKASCLDKACGIMGYLWKYIGGNHVQSDGKEYAYLTGSRYLVQEQQELAEEVDRYFKVTERYSK